MEKFSVLLKCFTSDEVNFELMRIFCREFKGTNMSKKISVKFNSRNNLVVKLSNSKKCEESEIFFGLKKILFKY